MSRRWAWIAVVGAACCMGGCEASEESAGPQVGSNSNWLRACEGPVDCSADDIPECACGVCTVACAGDEDCAGIENARCALEASAAARTACEAEPGMSSGICLPRCEPGTCGDGQACVNGACVLAVLPDNEFCNALPASTEMTRALEEELLALIEARRTAEGLACEGQPMSLPQPALRLSPSLMCAARALAADLAMTRTPGVLDSQGRDTRERMQLAGYDPLLWADAYALEAESPEHALSLMLPDLATCMRLTDPDFLDLGLGVTANVYILTLGTR